ncbi:hypothetical protein ACFRA5_42075, partial [Streptomyces mirabilis]
NRSPNRTDSTTSTSVDATDPAASSTSTHTRPGQLGRNNRHPQVEGGEEEGDGVGVVVVAVPFFGAVAAATALLATENNERVRVPILIIEEAHLLDHEQLEAIRMRTNDEMDSNSPLACLLIASPPCGTRSNSVSWPPWTSGSRSATTCRP